MKSYVNKLILWTCCICISSMLYAVDGSSAHRIINPTVEKVDAVNPLNKETIEVEITSPHFFDPKGDRLRG